jgi:NADPH2:quinone reductase
MRAAVCRRLGRPEEQVAVEEVPEPHLAEGQVLVEVRAAGVNFVDALMVNGGYQITPPLPFTPGSEVAGVVAQVGPGVSGWEPGDQVFATVGLGGFSSHVAVGQAALHRVPPGLSFAQAATFVQSYATMLFSYTRRDRLSPGEWVLVLGAGGGIGLAAVDLARALGCQVVAAASSPEKLEAARRAGASHLVAYEREDLKTRVRELTGGGAHVAVDPVGGKQAEPALRALRTGGRFHVIGFASGSIPSIRLNLVLLNNRSVIGVDWGGWTSANPKEGSALVDELVSMAEQGRISPATPTEMPLQRAPEVLAGLLDRKVAGKLVLVP